MAVVAGDMARDGVVRVARSGNIQEVCSCRGRAWIVALMKCIRSNVLDVCDRTGEVIEGRCVL